MGNVLVVTAHPGDFVWRASGAIALHTRAFECLPAQTHLWSYYERVALNRGQQASRNSLRKITHGEAYQRVFPEALDALR